MGDNVSHITGINSVWYISIDLVLEASGYFLV
jgi:hypothetical protein